MRIDVVDLSHRNQPVDFHALKAAGVVGVILKATEGTSEVDPCFADRYPRAVSVFGRPFVHAYHFLTDDAPAAQASHFYDSTPGVAFRWLDYERNPDGPTCSLPTALKACQTLQGLQRWWPGMYGSDLAYYGAALEAGHFLTCPRWIARYRDEPPDHTCQLWQYDEQGQIGGMTGLDFSTYLGSGSCADWLRGLAL